MWCPPSRFLQALADREAVNVKMNGFKFVFCRPRPQSYWNPEFEQLYGSHHGTLLDQLLSKKQRYVGQKRKEKASGFRDIPYGSSVYMLSSMIKRNNNSIKPELRYFFFTLVFVFLDLFQYFSSTFQVLFQDFSFFFFPFFFYQPNSASGDQICHHSAKDWPKTSTKMSGVSFPSS
jgi:hypothetical protein